MINWRDLTIQSNGTLLDALRVIDRGALQFALVVENEILVGMVTDGDIRRGLMRGLATTAPIRVAMNPKPVVGLNSEPVSQWRKKLRQHGIKHLPIVSESGVLLRVVTDKTCAEPRENWAVVMAGGLGSRLGPITQQIPKPMVEIGGAPILETILRSLTNSGISRVFFSVNYRADVIVDYFGDGSRWDVRIEYLRENVRLGTAGALSLLPESPSAPLIVMNGDILTALNYGDMLDEHQNSAAAATMCVREYDTQVPYGVVEVNGDEFRGIVEKPIVKHLASAGVYALSAEALKFVPSGAYFDMPSLFQSLLSAKLAVRVHRMKDYWIDIGRLDDLERARLDFQKEFQ